MGLAISIKIIRKRVLLLCGLSAGRILCVEPETCLDLFDLHGIPANADAREQQDLFSDAQTCRPVVIGFRAEDVTVVENEHADFVGQVSVVDRLGESTLAYLQTGDLVARLPATSEVVTGDRLSLQIDPEKIMWFDPDTGQNLLKEKT